MGGKRKRITFPYVFETVKGPYVNEKTWVYAETEAGTFGDLFTYEDLRVSLTRDSRKLGSKWFTNYLAYTRFFGVTWLQDVPGERKVHEKGSTSPAVSFNSHGAILIDNGDIVPEQLHLAITTRYGTFALAFGYEGFGYTVHRDNDGPELEVVDSAWRFHVLFHDRASLGKYNGETGTVNVRFTPRFSITFGDEDVDAKIVVSSADKTDTVPTPENSD